MYRNTIYNLELPTLKFTNSQNSKRKHISLNHSQPDMPYQVYIYIYINTYIHQQKRSLDRRVTWIFPYSREYEYMDSETSRNLGNREEFKTVLFYPCFTDIMTHHRDIPSSLPLYLVLKHDIEMMTTTLKLTLPHVCKPRAYVTLHQLAVKYKSFTPGGTPTVQKHTHCWLQSNLSLELHSHDGNSTSRIHHFKSSLRLKNSLAEGFPYTHEWCTQHSKLSTELVYRYTEFHRGSPSSGLSKFCLLSQ